MDTTATASCVSLTQLLLTLILIFRQKFSLDYPPCPTLPYSPAIERLVLHALALNLSGISRLENNEACKTLLAAQSYLAKVFYQIILIPAISNNSGYM